MSGQARSAHVYGKAPFEALVYVVVVWIEFVVALGRCKCILVAVKHSSLVWQISVSVVFNLWIFAEGEEPSCSVFLSSFCLFFCGSVPDPCASWSSLARFTGNEGRKEINGLVFRALKQHRMWGSLECKAIQMEMAQRQSGLHCSAWIKAKGGKASGMYSRKSFR